MADEDANMGKLRRFAATGLLLMGACGEPQQAAPPVALAADSLSAAEETCRGLVRDRLTSPTEAEFGPLTMRRDSATRAFVGRGEAMAPNPAGVPITHRYVCVLDVDGTGRGNVVFRSSDPATYEEMVRLLNL